MSRQSDGGPGSGTGPPQAKPTSSTAVAGSANPLTTNNNATTNADALPVFQSKRPPGRPRKQVPSELILQRKKIGYFPGRPRGSVRVRRKPASLEEGVSSSGNSLGSSTGSIPPPSPGGVGTPAPPAANNHQSSQSTGSCAEEPELAEGLVQGALTTTTTAAIMAGPQEPSEEPLCGLCNLAERNPYLSSSFLSARVGPAKLGLSSDPEKPQKRRRIRASKMSAEGSATCLEDICNVGVIPPGEEPLDVAAVADAQGTVRVHTVCARWSAGYESTKPGALELLLDESLRRACSHCRRLGASVRCAQEGCSRTYHLLCAVGAACAIDGDRELIYCQGEHSTQLKLTCETCARPTETRESLWCTQCAKYYHVSCTDTPSGTSVVSNLRMGWLCVGCRVCPICHGGSLDRAVTCDSCRKCYHMQCVRPALNHLPKHGYKCVLCRFCGDCGSRTPGSGPSSRWHMNYTVCDSCYQQRNKGMSCPLCGKAYRASSSSKMVDFTQCSNCKRYIHNDCDPAITNGDTRDYRDYTCPPCLQPRATTTDAEEMLSSLTPSLATDGSSGADAPCLSPVTVEEPTAAIGVGNYGAGKPMGAMGAMGPMGALASRGKGLRGMRRPRGAGRGQVGRPPTNPALKMRGLGRWDATSASQAKQVKKDFEFERDALLNVGGCGGNAAGKLTDEEATQDSKVVLFSANDKFVLLQDMCVLCGSFGIGEEGRLISCAQCGQCYHPYCCGAKVTQTTLTKGWRCLDCTVCEGCGQPHDESRLLLCDDCDTSYHTYCLKPPLETVPPGTWKCQHCVVCVLCGSRTPGPEGSEWQANYTECAPCSSKFRCVLCSQDYQGGDIIIECEKCRRWLHGRCDEITSEEDAERCCDLGYSCPLCRPKDTLPAHLVHDLLMDSPCPSPTQQDTPLPKQKVHHLVDGVYLTDVGLNTIKTLTLEPPKRTRTVKPKDALGNRLPTLPSLSGLTSLSGLPALGQRRATLDDLADGGDPFEFEADGILEGLEGDEEIKRKKKIQKLGIGGFVANARSRAMSSKDDATFAVETSASMQPFDDEKDPTSKDAPDSEKAQRQQRRRRPKKKRTIEESMPSHIQEAFFGMTLLSATSNATTDTFEDLDNNSMTDTPASEDDRKTTGPATSHRRKEPVVPLAESRVGPPDTGPAQNTGLQGAGGMAADLGIDNNLVDQIEYDELGDLLPSDLPQELRDDELMDMIMQEADGSGGPTVEADVLLTSPLPHMDGQDVENVFKGVLIPSVEGRLPPGGQAPQNAPGGIPGPTAVPGTTAPTALPDRQGISAPSPAPSWSSQDLDEVASNHSGGSNNKNNMLKWEPDEALAEKATISMVLYANIEHPGLKQKYPQWPDRAKQIAKIWRNLPTEKRAPYLQKARENRKARAVLEKTTSGGGSAGPTQSSSWKHSAERKANANWPGSGLSGSGPSSASNVSSLGSSQTWSGTGVVGTGGVIPKQEAQGPPSVTPADEGLDDDDLLELGADFNILEYADPENDTVTSSNSNTGDGCNKASDGIQIKEEDKKDAVDVLGHPDVTNGPQLLLGGLTKNGQVASDGVETADGLSKAHDDAGLLSDVEFERLKAEMFSTAEEVLAANTATSRPSQPSQTVGPMNQWSQPPHEAHPPPQQQQQQAIFGHVTSISQGPHQPHGPPGQQTQPIMQHQQQPQPQAGPTGMMTPMGGPTGPMASQPPHQIGMGPNNHMGPRPINPHQQQQMQLMVRSPIQNASPGGMMGRLAGPGAPIMPGAGGVSSPLRSVPPGAMAPTQALAQMAQSQPAPAPATIAQQFKLKTLPAPQAPSENNAGPALAKIKYNYEAWMQEQDELLSEQKKYLETEMGKLRKIKKALTAKQRQLARAGSGQELNNSDSDQLAYVNREMPGLQKFLEQVRKLHRQHTNIMQEYRVKNQQPAPAPGQSPGQFEGAYAPMGDQTPGPTGPHPGGPSGPPRGLMSPQPNYYQQSMHGQTASHAPQQQAPLRYPLVTGPQSGVPMGGPPPQRMMRPPPPYPSVKPMGGAMQQGGMLPSGTMAPSGHTSLGPMGSPQAQASPGGLPANPPSTGGPELFRQGGTPESPSHDSLTATTAMGLQQANSNQANTSNPQQYSPRHSATGSTTPQQCYSPATPQGPPQVFSPSPVGGPGSVGQVFSPGGHTPNTPDPGNPNSNSNSNPALLLYLRRSPGPSPAQRTPPHFPGMSPYQVQSPAAPPFSPHHAPSPAPSPSPGQATTMHSPAPSPARSAPSPKSSPMPPNAGRPNVYAVGINKPGGGGGLKGGSSRWMPAQTETTTDQQPLLLERLWRVDDDASAIGAREDLAELLDYLGEVMWTNMNMMSDNDQNEHTVHKTTSGWKARHPAPARMSLSGQVFAVGLNRQLSASGHNSDIDETAVTYHGNVTKAWPFGRLLGGNPDSLPGANGTQTTSAANASSSSSGDFGGSSFNVDGDVAEPGGVDNVDVTASVFVVQFDDENNSPNSALVSQPGGVSDPEQTSEQPEQASVESASEQADQVVDQVDQVVEDQVVDDPDQEAEDPSSEPQDEPTEQANNQPDPPGQSSQHPDEEPPDQIEHTTTFVATADVAVDDHNYFNTPSLPPTADEPEATAAAVEMEAPFEHDPPPADSGDQQDGVGVLANDNNSIVHSNADTSSNGGMISVTANSNANSNCSSNNSSVDAPAAPSPTQTAAINGSGGDSGGLLQPSVCSAQTTQETTSSLFVVADQNQNVTGVVQDQCAEPMEEDPAPSESVAASSPKDPVQFSAANGRPAEVTFSLALKVEKSDAADTPKAATSLQPTEAVVETEVIEEKDPQQEPQSEKQPQEDNVDDVQPDETPIPDEQPRCAGTPPAALLAGAVGAVTVPLSSVSPTPPTTTIPTQSTTPPTTTTAVIMSHLSKPLQVLSTIAATPAVIVSHQPTPPPPTLTLTSRHSQLLQQQQQQNVPKLYASPSSGTSAARGPDPSERTLPIPAASIKAATTTTSTSTATAVVVQKIISAHPSVTPTITATWAIAPAGNSNEQQQHHKVSVQQLLPQTSVTLPTQPQQQALLRTTQNDNNVQYQTVGVVQQKVTVASTGGGSGVGGGASLSSVVVLPKAAVIPVTFPTTTAPSGGTPTPKPIPQLTIPSTTTTTTATTTTTLTIATVPQQPEPQSPAHSSPSPLLPPPSLLALSMPNPSSAVAASAVGGATAGGTPITVTSTGNSTIAAVVSGSVSSPSSISSIPPKQNVLLKQLLQNCPSAESGTAPNAATALTGNGGSPVLVVKEQPTLITSQLVNNNNNNNHTIINNNSSSSGVSGTNNGSSGGCTASIVTPSSPSVLTTTPTVSIATHPLPVMSPYNSGSQQVTSKTAVATLTMSTTKTSPIEQSSTSPPPVAAVMVSVASPSTTSGSVTGGPSCQSMPPSNFTTRPSQLPIITAPATVVAASDDSTDASSSGNLLLGNSNSSQGCRVPPPPVPSHQIGVASSNQPSPSTTPTIAAGSHVATPVGTTTAALQGLQATQPLHAGQTGGSLLQNNLQQQQQQQQQGSTLRQTTQIGASMVNQITSAPTTVPCDSLKPTHQQQQQQLPHQLDQQTAMRGASLQHQQHGITTPPPGTTSAMQLSGPSGVGVTMQGGPTSGPLTMAIPSQQQPQAPPNRVVGCLPGSHSPYDGQMHKQSGGGRPPTSIGAGGMYVKNELASPTPGSGHFPSSPMGPPMHPNHQSLINTAGQQLQRTPMSPLSGPPRGTPFGPLPGQMQTGKPAQNNSQDAPVSVMLSSQSQQSQGHQQNPRKRPHKQQSGGLVSAAGAQVGPGSAGSSTSPTKKRAKKSLAGPPVGVRGEDAPGLTLASEPATMGETASGSLVGGSELGAPVSAKMRSLPAVRIVEPSIQANYSACPIFGRDRGTPIQPQLAGSFGSGELKKASKYGGDFYKHLGNSTRSSRARRNRLALNSRGFYNQEFSHSLSSNSDRTFSPETVCYCSSPENDVREKLLEMKGLRLISRKTTADSRQLKSSSDHNSNLMPSSLKCSEKERPPSPALPLYAPIPLRPSYDGHNLINELGHKSPHLNTAANGLLLVTLTLHSSRDVRSVLNSLSKILELEAKEPFADANGDLFYEIIERLETPLAEQKSEVEDEFIWADGGKKFCKNCDSSVHPSRGLAKLLLLNGKRKGNDETTESTPEPKGPSEEVFFCGETCYSQAALVHSLCDVPDTLSFVKEVLSELVKRVSEQTPTKPVQTRKPFLAQRPDPNKKSAKGTKWMVWESGTRQRLLSKKNTSLGVEEANARLDASPIGIRLAGVTDTRACLLCSAVGDAASDGPGRLLNLDTDKWVHLNCALWSSEVYETVNGSLMNVEEACRRAKRVRCSRCNLEGASVRCFKMRCMQTFHFGCARAHSCMFFKDKTVLCPAHQPKSPQPDLLLPSASVLRRVYISRDEVKQVAASVHRGENYYIRVGSLVFQALGQLLPQQLQNFHCPNAIYPCGFRVLRFYWHMQKLGQRQLYECVIGEHEGKPKFTITPMGKSDQKPIEGSTPKDCWMKVLEPIEKMRLDNTAIKVFSKYVTGQDLFGLTEPLLLRLIESIPGVDTLLDYTFRYGPSIDLPLAVNPSGCARSEPKLRTHFKRSHALLHSSNAVGATGGWAGSGSGGSSAASGLSASTGTPASLAMQHSLLLCSDSPGGQGLSPSPEMGSPYSKQFVHSKASQYRRMKTEWRTNVYLARSKIQGLGLYAARDIEKHTMVIEYIGQVIRNEVANAREKQYESQNRGIYMFRLDENRVIDATLTGGLARYVNHSCNPNCVTEVVDVDKDQKILIIAKRRIARGEELSYDYKFDFEDDQHKIACLCGAPNCKKWMN